MKRTSSFLSLLFLTILSLYLPRADAQTVMEKKLQPLIDEGKMPGILSIVATKERILELDAIGYANIEQKTPIAPDQIFWTASMTKFMTATALMILVDEGKVSLNDPIDQYIPEMKLNLRVEEERDGGTFLRAPHSMPTIRECLTHTSGLPFASEFMKRYGADCLPLRYQVFSISLTPLLADPGEKYTYSELGIDIIGEIIEIVSGIPYEQFMQERIFDPLDMKDTTFWPTPEQQSRMAQCYTCQNGALVPIETPAMTPPYEDKTTRFPEPGSGVFSTGYDLLKFFQMHAALGTYQGKRILSEQAIRTMMMPDPKTGINKYGLGTARDGIWFGHSGMCGTLCNATTDGLIRIYLTQVYEVPANGEGVHLWSKGVDQILRNNHLLKE